VIAELQQAQSQVNHAQRALLRAILRCDLRRTYLQDDCRDTAQWVSLQLGVNGWKARRLVACAAALESLPHTEKAFEEGLLSLDKLVELTRLATPADEKSLVKWARRVAVATIRDRADEARRIPETAVRDAERSRYLDWWWSDDHTRMHLEGSLPAVDGARVAKALDHLAEHLPTHPDSDADPVATLPARRADALVALIESGSAHDSEPDRADLVVYTSLQSLLGKELNGIFEGGRPLSARDVGELVCDSRLQLLLEEGGQLVGDGFTRRLVSPQVRRALERRDHFCCTFPGCGRRAKLHAHHIVPWPIGPTDLDNLVLVCSFHHRLIHKGGWHVALKDGMTDWFRPDWTPYIPRDGPVAA